MAKSSKDATQDSNTARSPQGPRPDRRHFLYSAGLGVSTVALLAAFRPKDAQGSIEPSSWISPQAPAGIFIIRGVIDTVFDLRNAPRPRGQNVATFVRGYAQIGDGGQGTFYWDPAETRADNNGFIIRPVTVSGPGRWRRDWDGHRLNVKWFGARGDGSLDDRAAIQTALDNAPAHGMVFLPPGDYRVDSQLFITNDPVSKQRNIRLVGSNAGARGSDRTRLVWHGPAEGHILQLRSRNCIIEHLDFIVSPTASSVARSAVFVRPNPAGAPPTNNIFRHCTFHGSVGDESNFGPMRYGVIVDEAPGNMDFFRFVKCQFRGLTEAGFFLDNSSRQSKGHTFEDCRFENPGEPLGTGIKARSGSLQCYSCFFRGLERAIHTGTLDSLTLVDTESERCKRFLDTFLGNARTSKQWPVTLLGGFFNISLGDFQTPFADGTAFDGQYLLYTHGGQLTVQGCMFDSGDTYFQNFKIETIGRTPDTPSLICIGNRFPTDEPFSAGGTRHRLISLGNKGLVQQSQPGTGFKFNLPDQFVQNGPVAGLIPLTVQALSGTTMSNLRGRTSIPAGQVTQAVTLPIEEPDNNFFVTATLNFTTGSPANMGIGVAVSVANKTTTGFDLRLAAPVGFNADVDWMLMR